MVGRKKLNNISLYLLKNFSFKKLVQFDYEMYVHFYNLHTTTHTATTIHKNEKIKMLMSNKDVSCKK